jgi:hypothetical protein
MAPMKANNLAKINNLDANIVVTTFRLVNFRGTIIKLNYWIGKWEPDQFFE